MVEIELVPNCELPWTMVYTQLSAQHAALDYLKKRACHNQNAKILIY